MMVSSGSKLVKSLTLNREMTGRQKNSKAFKKVSMRVQGVKKRMDPLKTAVLKLGACNKTYEHS